MNVSQTVRSFDIRAFAEELQYTFHKVSYTDFLPDTAAAHQVADVASPALPPTLYPPRGTQVIKCDIKNLKEIGYRFSVKEKLT